MAKSPSWDDTFIDICDVVSRRSKDESTKLGCVIVGPSKEIRSVGYNSFPRGIDDNNPKRQLRPAKYFYFEHSERNALYNALLTGTSVEGCICYVSFYPCADCARGLIQAGVSEIVCRSDVVPERFRENCTASEEMLREAGVFVRLVNKTSPLILKIGDDWGKERNER